jgi:hypothetical protein
VAITNLAFVAAQSLFLAEVVAILVARRQLGRELVRQMGDSWHERLEALTSLTRPALFPAVFMVVALAAGAALGVTV